MKLLNIREYLKQEGVISAYPKSYFLLTYMNCLVERYAIIEKKNALVTGQMFSRLKGNEEGLVTN